MRAIFAAVLLCFTLFTSENVAAQSVSNGGDSISGRWSGSYAGSGNRTTPFELVLTQTGSRLSGRVTEPNLFGDASARFLYANVVGRRDGNRITFTKTYDGTGGQTHSVAYEGQLDRTGRRVTGTWQLRGASGSFEMSR